MSFFGRIFRSDCELCGREVGRSQLFDFRDRNGVTRRLCDKCFLNEADLAARPYRKQPIVTKSLYDQGYATGYQGISSIPVSDPDWLEGYHDGKGDRELAQPLSEEEQEAKEIDDFRDRLIREHAQEKA